jgi:hypothetical protein
VALCRISQCFETFPLYFSKPYKKAASRNVVALEIDPSGAVGYSLRL